MTLRCRHVSLSESDADELLHLIRTCLNSSSKNGTQFMVGLDLSSLKTSVST